MFGYLVFIQKIKDHCNSGSGIHANMRHACKISGQPFLRYMMKTSFMNVSIGPGWKPPSLPFPHTRINIFMQSDHKAAADNEHSKGRILDSCLK
jgi:hypothetical protein